jgi:hypothetical protein
MLEALHLVAAVVAVVGAVAVGSTAVPLTRRTVLAAAPWSVAAAGVVVAGRAGVYRTDTAVLLAAVGGVAVGAWVLFAHLAALRELPCRDRYLAASGLGAAVVVVAALASHVDGIAPSRVVWLAFAPVVAALLAAAGYFVLGLVYTDALVALRLAGLYVVGTVVLDGVATAASGAALGAEQYGVVTAGVAAVVGSLGVDLAVWQLLPVQAAVAVAFGGLCGWLARLYGPAGNGFALLASTVSLTSATVVLLSATFLG